MSPTLTTIPPEILDKIIQQLAFPRTSKSPLARQSTDGDLCLDDLSRNNSASATLSPLSQTCKVLRTHCLPHIFITASVRSSDGMYKLKKSLEQSEVLANIAQKNARSLSICVEFRLLKDVSRYDKNKNRIEWLGSILRYCPSLTALHLSNVFFDDEMFGILEQMKTLRSLSFEAVYSGTKTIKLKKFNELCRRKEDCSPFDQRYTPSRRFPPLESLYFSPPLRNYDYHGLLWAVASSLKELSINCNTACGEWTKSLVGSSPEQILPLAILHFPCLERVFFQLNSFTLLEQNCHLLIFLLQHRETLREFTMLPKRMCLNDHIPNPTLARLLSLVVIMAAGDIHQGIPVVTPRNIKPLPIDGFSFAFGERLTPSDQGGLGRRPVLEIGLSIGEKREDLGDDFSNRTNNALFEFPLLDLGALLAYECFDEIKLIAFDTIYRHASFFFSDLITQLEKICTTRFTKLKDISLSWDARDTYWSRSEPRLFTKLPSSFSNYFCKFNDEWVSANYSIAESIICCLFQNTAIERLELVPIFDLSPLIRIRDNNFPPFESWVWRKSQCGSKVHAIGTLWKRSKRAHFTAVGMGSERETENYWTEPVIDEDESDELTGSEPNEDDSSEYGSDEDKGNEDEGHEDEGN